MVLLAFKIITNPKYVVNKLKSICVIDSTALLIC
jgi:hypothetical protein